ncbi:hypothetical protein PENTCL1PPCAC_29423, partial [Pristionchus entomophagus]
YSAPRSDNLERHLRETHKLDEDVIKSLREQRKQVKASARQDHPYHLPFPCPHCDLRYSTDHSLRQRLRQKHPEVRLLFQIKKPNVCCPVEECTVEGLRSREELAAHCRVDHSDAGDFEIIDRSFTTMAEMQ